MGIFDLNENANVVKEPFMGSNLYYIDNFYKNPDSILEFFSKSPKNKHTPGRDTNAETLNGIYFDDDRITIENNEVSKVWNHLSDICGHSPVDIQVLTNHFRFRDKNFNKSKDNFWYPHIDHGYTAIVYFNKNDTICGTNLYRSIQEDLPISRGEHVDPWRSKQNWELLTTLKPAYNRCVIFDGEKFPHGMHITDNCYFDEEYRTNQIFFFYNAEGHEDLQQT
jgi:hypothetical protein